VQKTTIVLYPPPPAIAEKISQNLKKIFAAGFTNVTRSVKLQFDDSPSQAGSVKLKLDTPFAYLTSNIRRTCVTAPTFNTEKYKPLGRFVASKVTTYAPRS